MKIAIVNRRYFKSSGPESYLFAIKQMLEDNGNQVYPFSVKRKGNYECISSEYFVNPPAGEDVLFYKDYNVNKLQALKIFCNAIYSFEAHRKASKLFKEKQIDLLYLLGIVNDISPSVISAAYSMNIPVVMRISDYYLLCPEYRFLRDGKICQDCFDGYYHALKYKCVQGRFAPTLTRVLSMYVHKWIRIYDKVSYFITPSECMRQNMIQGGFPEERIKFIPSFIDITDKDPCYENKGYILYIGRISTDKGVMILLEAISKGKINTPVLIIGESTDDTLGKLKDYALKHELKNVDFVGFKKGKELEALIKGAIFTVVPSIWLDNSPMSVLESMAFGKPVIGSDVGGISEQITDECGMKFSVGDASALAYKMKELLSLPERIIIEMGKKGRKRVETYYSPGRHYKALLEIFVHVLQKRKIA